MLSAWDSEDQDAPVRFKLGEKEGKYYRLAKEVLGSKRDIYIHEDFPLTTKMFMAERNISVLRKLDALATEIVRIGGDEENSIPKDAYLELIKKFPNSTELNKYTLARIGAVISSYIATKSDYEEKYQRYMNNQYRRPKCISGHSQSRVRKISVSRLKNQGYAFI